MTIKEEIIFCTPSIGFNLTMDSSTSTSDGTLTSKKRKLTLIVSNDFEKVIIIYCFHMLFNVYLFMCLLLIGNKFFFMCYYFFLLDWNIDRKISIITVDNCSSNDGMIDILLEKLSLSRSLLLNEKVFYMWCARKV